MVSRWLMMNFISSKNKIKDTYIDIMLAEIKQLCKVSKVQKVVQKFSEKSSEKSNKKNAKYNHPSGSQIFKVSKYWQSCHPHFYPGNFAKRQRAEGFFWGGFFGGILREELLSTYKLTRNLCFFQNFGVMQEGRI